MIRDRMTASIEGIMVMSMGISTNIRSCQYINIICDCILVYSCFIIQEY